MPETCPRGEKTGKRVVSGGKVPKCIRACREGELKLPFFSLSVDVKREKARGVLREGECQRKETKDICTGEKCLGDRLSISLERGRSAALKVV